jgi:tRNA A-37 threonylcarbamoyl transferase component Bud32
VTAPTLAAGRVLGGRYQLARLLARGGMAEVWEGHDATLSRPVAVKILQNHLAADAIFVERFRREAVTAARLGHHAIVATYDAGIDSGTAYIVMELVRGRTLRQFLTSTGALDPALAVGIAMQIADALAYAHRCGLIHRDVKPANVLLCDEDGAVPQVKVTDFGIAKTTAELGQDLTATGTVLGTPKYFSPEQVEGRHEPDARSDLYALGVVLFEMLTGRVPFDGPTEMATALAHLRDTPPSVTALRPAVPPAVDSLVQKLLAKSPADRPPTAVAARQALELLASDLAAARLKGSRGQYRGVGTTAAGADGGSTVAGDRSSPGGRSVPDGRSGSGNGTGYPLPTGSRRGPGRDSLGTPALNGPVGAGGWTPSDRPAAPPFPDGRAGRPAPTSATRSARSPTAGPPHPVTAHPTSPASSYAAWARGPVTGSVASARVVPGRAGSQDPAETQARGMPSAAPEGPPTRAVPTRGTPPRGTSPPGPPTRGTPTRGTPSRGTPSRGTPSGAAARGVPDEAPVSPPVPSVRRRTPRRATGRNGRFVAVVVSVIVVAALVVGALLLSDRPSGRRQTTTTTPPVTPAAPVKIRAVSVWMDNDRSPDNTDETKYTIDGKASTAWQTVVYQGIDKATFSGLYTGEGLAIELTGRRSVAQLKVTSTTQGWAASTYVSDTEPATGAPVSSWGDPTVSHANIDGDATFDLKGRKGRWVLLWLTNIGPLGQASINELSITS